MKLKTVPYKHQRRACHVSLFKSVFAFFMEMGTGKSKVIIDTAARLFSDGCIKALIVITPNGLQQNWVLRELPTHMSIPYIASCYYSDMPMREKREWNAVMKLAYPPKYGIKVLTINYEQLLVPKMFAALVAFMRAYETLLVLDESQRIKNKKAARTKRAWQLGTFAKYRRILSGTPVTQSPLDLYCQFFFLNPKILGFGNSFTAFKHTYAQVQRVFTNDPNNRYGYYEEVIGYRRLPELKAKIKAYTYSIRKKDCLDIPDKIPPVNVHVRMTTQQKRIYKELRNQAGSDVYDIDRKGMNLEELLVYLTVEKNKFTVGNALTKMLRMQQVLGGFIPDDASHMKALDNNRIKDLISVLKDLPNDTKAIIWAQFRAEIKGIVEAIKEEFGNLSYVEYHGGVKAKDRTRSVDLFQTNPYTRFFIGHPAAGGLGLTLTAATTVVWYSVGCNLEHFLQANDRPHRIGQHHPVSYIHLVVPDTLDIAVLKMLSEKERLAKEVV